MRLGIMGGTFDPVHLGHLFVADIARGEAQLDSVLFLPDGDPPHKRPGASGADRLHMVELAIAGQPQYAVSDMELKRPGRTYTVDTLLQLRQENPSRELYYLIGTDTLLQFPTWKTAWKVATLCRMLVVPRPGNDLAEIRWFMGKLNAEYGLESQLLSRMGPDISSTQVRAHIKKGQPLLGLVPVAVADYILKEKLYIS